MEKETVKLTKLSKCAGCGAKVGAGVLAQLLQDIKVHSDPNLLVGFDHSDDASVYKISDELALVQTVDFFPPIADDPYLFGQIAATNALSDVYAMGGEPKLCLNIMAVPEKMPMDAVHDILRGGYDKVYEAGALITGGHSIHDDEPKYGLAVTGFVHPDRVLTNSGAKPGDVLFLTKPLGIGILSTAAKADMVSEEGQRRMFELMTTLNRSARDVMVKYDVHACTDVTGFGLMGHCFEMMEGSDTQAVIYTEALDLIRVLCGIVRRHGAAQGVTADIEMSVALPRLCPDGKIVRIDQFFRKDFRRPFDAEYGEPLGHGDEIDVHAFFRQFAQHRRIGGLLHLGAGVEDQEIFRAGSVEEVAQRCLAHRDAVSALQRSPGLGIRVVVMFRVKKEKSEQDGAHDDDAGPDAFS